MNHNSMQRLGLLAVIALLAAALLGLPAASGQSMPAGIATQMATPANDSSSPDASLTAQNPIPDWSVSSASTMADAGDVNGDGYDDVILQATYYSDGTAKIFYGSADGLGVTANWTVGYAGNMVSGMGDVNGDGYSDVLIGRLVFHGSPSGPPPAANWGLTQNGRPAGYTGDVNGDGYDDLLVGDPYYSNGQSYEGRLAVYFGSASGLGTSPGWTLEGDRPERYLGYTVAAVGDVNKDGCDDIVASSLPGDTLLHEIYLGSPAGPAPSPIWSTLVPSESNVAMAGDVNCDSFDDVIVGIPDRYYPPARGQALVYTGSPSGVSSDPAWQVESDRSRAQFAQAAVAAGDVNGDGCGDVAIGAPNYASNTAGYLFVYMGSPQGLSFIPQWQAFRLTGGAGFGTTASTAGDVNGDGHDELLGAHPADSYFAGAVYGFYGSAAGLRETVFAAQRTSQPPTIDGDLGDWESTTRFALDITSAETIRGEPPAVEDAAAWVRARWDLLNLYLAVHVSDDVIVNDSGDVWRDDEIELGFYAVYDGNPAGHDTHQYTVNPDGRVSVFGNPAVPIPIETAVRIVPGGWDVELRIPHTHLFGFYHPFTVGSTLSFNVGLHDDDDGGDWDSYLVWQGSSTITNGDAFGEMLLVIPNAPLPPTPTPTATPRSTPTPTATPFPTPTITPTPTASPMPAPDLQYSLKSAQPTVVAPDEPVVYTITLYNSGRAQGLITLIDVPPLPYVPDSAGGGLAWDPVTASLRWRGTMLPGDWRQFGYTLAGPSVCVPPGTVYTNTLTIDDGYHPPFTRAASVVVASGPTPWASCTPTLTATATPTATPTATASPVVAPVYLPLILHQ
jgi:hypothetical protein